MNNHTNASPVTINWNIFILYNNSYLILTNRYHLSSIYPGGQWVKISPLICWLSQSELDQTVLLRELKYVQEDSWLRFAFVFFYLFPSHKSLMKREWKGNEKKKKKRSSMERISPLPSILGAEQPKRLQIILHKSKTLSQLPERKPFQRYIP